MTACEETALRAPQDLKIFHLRRAPSEVSPLAMAKLSHARWLPDLHLCIDLCRALTTLDGQRAGSGW